jgi:phosphohistidine phosphatase
VPEIIVMRHAAAVPAAAGASDFERELSGPGRVEAVQAARRLAGEAPGIDRILYSPAHRTAATARIVAAELALAGDAMVAVPSLYAANAAEIRAAIAREHGGARVLLVVGHNPGISDFGGELAQRGRHLHTAGYARQALDDEDWQELLRRAGRAPR